MNFYTYLVETRETVAQYVEDGLLVKQSHPTLPLDIYCYGRKAVYENVWDNVTSKCRGIVIDRETEEIVGRPFEKFHNYSQGADKQEDEVMTMRHEFVKPYFWEKMDGFMLTRFDYKGQTITTSKSSFQSIHAKWGTAMYAAKWPENTTQVFEGISPNFRIVVDYGDREELVLLAIIDNETGEEMQPAELRFWAEKNGLRIPQFSVGELKDFNEKVEGEAGINVEGFVATWYREGQTPFRLKLKYVEYQRLHRMITGISPKQIAKLLEDGKLDDIKMLKDTTPWMAKFVDKWENALMIEFNRIRFTVDEIYMKVYDGIETNPGVYSNLGDLRKAYALEFTKPASKPYQKALFAKLDGRSPDPVIWGMVRNKLTVGKGPLVQNY